MGKSEEEIQPLNPEDSLVEITTGEDSPKSKSPRHGHSTSKEVIRTARSSSLFCTAPNSVTYLPDQSQQFLWQQLDVTVTMFVDASRWHQQSPLVGYRDVF